MCAFIFFGPRTLCGARMGRRKLSLFEQKGRDRWKESELFLCCVRKRSEQPLSISIVATTPLVTWTPLPGNLVKHSWHKSPKAWRTRTLQSVCPMSDGYRVTIVCMYCETLAFLKLQNSG